jgi:TP901 family phage tail tape measure protein
VAARAKIYEVAFQIGGKMQSSFSGSMLNAQKNLGMLNKKVSELERGGKDVERFRKLKKDVQGTEEELRNAQKEVANLAKELKATDKPSASLQSNFDKSRKKARQLKDRLLDQRTAAARLSRGMGKAGISTRNLAADNVALTRRLARTKVAQQQLNKVMLMQQSNKKDRSEKRAGLFDAAAMGGSLAFPMMFAARFEQSMAEVRAISGATDEDFAALSAQAKQLGATTSFSASQAAGGMKYLAMAGFKTNQVIAAMPGLLSMARAGGTDLAQTSDIASDIMSGFGIEAGQMNRVADVLTQTFTTSNTTLEMLGETMKYVGPVATKAGMGLEEAAAMAGLLGNVGIKASQSGTVLKGMLLRLAAPSDGAAIALEKLGVQALDSQGDVRPLIDILGEVAKATDDMGSGEQLGYLKTIFGEEPAAGMAELIGKEGEKGISKYLEVIKNSKGKANKTAAIMDQTLIGSMKRLGSAGEGLAISVGTTLIPAITYLADSASWVTSKIIALTTRFPKTTSAVALVTAGVIGLSVAAMAGGYAITFITGGVLNTVRAYNLMQAACTRSRLQLLALTIQQKASAAATTVMTAAQWAWNVAMNANPIGLAIAGVAALSAGAVALYRNFKPFTILVDNTWALIKSFGGGVWSGLTESFIPVLDMFTEMKIAVGSAFNEIGTALAPVFSIFSGIKASVGSVFTEIGAFLSPIRGYFAELIGPIDASGQAMSGFAVVGSYIGKMFGFLLKTALLPVLATIKGITIAAKTVGAIKRFFTGDKKEDSKPYGRKDISKTALGNSTTDPDIEMKKALGTSNINKAALYQVANAGKNSDLAREMNLAAAAPDYTQELLNRSEKSTPAPAPMQVTVSPIIHIAAGADAGQVRQAVNAGMDESTDRLKESIESIRHNDRRLSFG